MTRSSGTATHNPTNPLHLTPLTQSPRAARRAGLPQRKLLADPPREPRYGQRDPEADQEPRRHDVREDVERGGRRRHEVAVKHVARDRDAADRQDQLEPRRADQPAEDEAEGAGADEDVRRGPHRG